MQLSFIFKTWLKAVSKSLFFAFCIMTSFFVAYFCFTAWLRHLECDQEHPSAVACISSR